MPETIRQFASDRLNEVGETSDARRRHADAMLTFAGEARAGLEGAERPRWIAAVDAELANIRVALASTEEGDHAEYRLHLVCALDQYWIARGPVSEILVVLRSGLTRVDSEELRAEALRPELVPRADRGPGWRTESRGGATRALRGPRRRARGGRRDRAAPLRGRAAGDCR